MAEKNILNKKSSLIKIRSKYILRQIFDYLQNKKLLKIICHNKTFQNNLDKNLNDYIIEHLKIEIEIIPAEYKYGKFFNNYELRSTLYSFLF